MTDPREHTADCAGGAEPARRAVRQVAAEWGAELEETAAGILVVLPVVAGLRRGLMRGRLEVVDATGSGAPGCRLILRVEDAELRLHAAAFAVLALAGAGGLLACLWPFFPRLLPLVPMALVLAVAGWLLVGARLRNSGPEEFLAAVAARAAHEAEPEGPG